MPQAQSDTDRRGFLKLLNVVIGGVIAAVMSVPLLRYLFFPVRRGIVSGATDAVVVGTLKEITRIPSRMEIIISEQRDAWSKVENVRLGAAWVFRDDAGQIKAFTTSCPHLGCSVDYDKDTDKFRCPCHSSSFDRDGIRISGPAKRGLDPLPAIVDDKGRVAVRFLRFKPDTAGRQEG